MHPFLNNSKPSDGNETRLNERQDQILQYLSAFFERFENLVRFETERRLLYQIVAHDLICGNPWRPLELSNSGTMYLGNNILTIRTKWKESQEGFGKRFGVGRSLVGKWESGDSDPSVTILVQLEELTGVPFSRLVGERLGVDDLSSYPRQREGKMPLAKEPEEEAAPLPKLPVSTASTGNEEILEALKALRMALEAEREISANERAENARFRKEFELMKKRLELMDAELLRLAGKKR